MSETAISNIPIEDRRASSRWRIGTIASVSGLLISMSACASDSYSTINGSVHVDNPPSAR
jgi:hypothetical protein